MNPGAYDNLAREVQQRTKAKAVMLVVLDGTQGSGNSIRMSTQEQKQALFEVLLTVLDSMLTDQGDVSSKED